MTSPTILEELGLAATPGGKASDRGPEAFTLIHTGARHVRAGTVLDLIRRQPELLPPRTGHLGNWGQIAAGRSGPMDFNSAVCGSGYGYPMIYGFTRTETAAGHGAGQDAGDTAYLPGSLIERGRRTELPLYTWGGRAYVKRDRSRSLFCALTQTEYDGELTPLVDLQWRRMLAIPGYWFKHWAEFLVGNGPLVLDMLCLLLEQASRKENSRRAFSELISHAVRLDGEVSRCTIERVGAGYTLDGHLYPSARELAEAVLLTARALLEPRWFFARIRSLPPVLPVMALQLSTILFGLLNTHLSDAADRSPANQPSHITHLHWGARAMAGCPPRRGGYLAEKSRIRSLRAIADELVRNFTEVKPLCFVLLPAQIFQLCPPSTSASDVGLLTGLFKELLAADPDGSYETTLDWLSVHRDQLSGYLRSRFRAGSGLSVGEAEPGLALPVEPDGFGDLTTRQLSSAVAAFEEVLG